MGSRGRRLSQARARKTRERLIESITTQQRQFGIIPSSAQAEKFLADNHVLEQAEHEHEAERSRRMLVREADPSAPTRMEDVAELERKIAANSEDPENPDRLHDPGGYQVVTGPAPKVPKKVAELREIGRRAMRAWIDWVETRLWIRWLRERPEWKAKLDGALWGKTVEQAEMPVRRVLDDAKVRFPNDWGTVRAAARRREVVLAAVQEFPHEYIRVVAELGGAPVLPTPSAS